MGHYGWWCQWWSVATAVKPAATSSPSKKMAVATGTVPYPLLETLQVRYRIFSRKPLEYGTVLLFT